MDRIAKSFMVFFFICIFLLPEGLAFAKGELATGWEPISLFNDRVRITGTFDTEVKVRLHILKHPTGEHYPERWARKSNLSLFRSNLSLEAEWWMIKQPTWELNLISHWYYSYGFMGELDTEFREAMPHRSYKQYLHTRDEDFIRELYFQLIRDPWDIRIGKQQVVWGQQLGFRGTDVINPIDLTTGVIGLTEWENIRIGLWMLRGIYHSTLPGELDFEVVFIPNDYENVKIPLEGTYLGGISNEFNPGFLDHLWYRMEHDKPGYHGLHNAEWGFRIRGYSTTFNLDWTLIYFHTLDDGPVTVDVDKFSDWLLKDFPGVPYLERPRMPRGIFEYKPYNIFGGTLLHYSPLLKAVLRLEIAYEDDRHYDAAGGRVVERDGIDLGLGIDKDLKIPYIYEWQGSQAMSIGLELHQKWWIDYRESIDFSRDHPRGDTYDTSVSWFIMMHFLNDNLLPLCRGTYFFTGVTQFSITFPYKPGEHWSYSIGISQYLVKRDGRVPKTALEHRDAVTFKISYIF